MTDVRDCMGKTVSHHLAMFPKCPDSQLSQIKLREQDWESGYTPFHLALLSHQLHKCFKLFRCSLHDANDLGKSWQIKDRSGMTPMLLLESILLNSVKRQDSPNKLSRKSFHKCFNFGSNVNMQLGTGDNNDRMGIWYQIDSWKMSGEDLNFVSCSMAKYHSILIMSDSDGNRSSFITGNATNGRVVEKRDLLRYKKLEILDLIKLEASNYHSIGLTEGGSLLLWGSNKYGQLNLNPKTFECVNQPRVIELNLNRDDLISCSNVHTSILMKNGHIKSFGLNLGQMGTTSKFEWDTSYLDGRGKITPHIITTELPSYISDQLSLVATDFVTFILCRGNKLFAVTNYKILKINVTPTTDKSFDKFFSRPFYHSHIIDIKCKNSHGKFLTILYDNGTVASIPDFRVTSTPQRYWEPKYSWDKCHSFDVGSEGQLILATEKGDVYSSIALGRKFNKLKNGMSGCSYCEVTCDSLFASFNILCKERSFSTSSPTSAITKAKMTNNHYDLCFETMDNEKFYCHRAVFASAQPKLMKELIEKGKIYWIEDKEFVRLNIDISNDSLWIVTVQCSAELFEYLNCCIDSFYSVDRSEVIRPTSKDLWKFIDLYYLPGPLCPPRDLKENLLNIFSETLPVDRNVTIKLKGNKTLKTFSFILEATSNYFEKFFSDLWSKDRYYFVLEWEDVSYSVCYSILELIHQVKWSDTKKIILRETGFAIGHNGYVDHLLQMLEVADKFMFLSLHSCIEVELIALIDSTNVMQCWIASYDFSCMELARRCEEYILMNPEILFFTETVESIDKNVSEEMWIRLEKLFQKHVPVDDKTRVWYNEQAAKQWIEELQHNMQVFNSHFMEPGKEFDLSSDSISSKHPRKKSILSNKKPGVSKLRRNNPLEQDLTNIRRPSINSENINPWSTSYTSDIDSAIEDDSELNSFTSVTRRKNRRASSTVSNNENKSSTTLVNVPVNNSTSSFNSRKSSIDTTFPTIGESSTRPASGSKIIIKKETQKEKIKRIAEEESKLQKSNESKKSVWGKPLNAPAGIPVKEKSNLSSKVLETTPISKPSTKFPTLHDALKMGKKSTGIISVSGDGTKPTMPLYLNKNRTSSSSVPSSVKPPFKSTQEALEEARFMKWWQEESKRVQEEDLAIRKLSGYQTDKTSVSSDGSTIDFPRRNSFANTSNSAQKLKKQSAFAVVTPSNTGSKRKPKHKKKLKQSSDVNKS